MKQMFELLGETLSDVSSDERYNAAKIRKKLEANTKKLSQQLLGWGMAMAFVGALYCQLVFGYLHLGSPG
jgi:hypothetical protein